MKAGGRADFETCFPTCFERSLSFAGEFVNNWEGDHVIHTPKGGDGVGRPSVRYPLWVLSGDWIMGRGEQGPGSPASHWSVTDPRSLLERDLHRAPNVHTQGRWEVSIERVRAPIRSSMDVAPDGRISKKSSLSLLHL